MALPRVAVALLVAAALAPAWLVALASPAGLGASFRVPSVPSRVLAPLWSTGLPVYAKAPPVVTPGGYVVVIGDDEAEGGWLAASLDPGAGRVLARRSLEGHVKPVDLQAGRDASGDYVALMNGLSDEVIVLEVPGLGLRVRTRPLEGDAKALLYLGNGSSLVVYQGGGAVRVAALRGNETLWARSLGAPWFLDSCRGAGRLLVAAADKLGNNTTRILVAEAGPDGVRVLLNETLEGRLFPLEEYSASFSPDCRLLAVALEEPNGTALWALDTRGGGAWSLRLDGFLGLGLPIAWSSNGSVLAVPLANSSLSSDAGRVVFLPRGLLTGGGGEPVEYRVQEEGASVYRLHAVYDTSRGPVAVIELAPPVGGSPETVVYPVGWGEPVTEDYVYANAFSPGSGTLYLAYLDPLGITPVILAYTPGPGGLERSGAYPVLLPGLPDQVAVAPSTGGDRLVVFTYTGEPGSLKANVTLMGWRSIERVYEDEKRVVAAIPEAGWWSYNRTLTASGPGYEARVRVEARLLPGAAYWYTRRSNGTTWLVAGSYGAVARINVTVLEARGVQRLELRIADRGRGSLLAVLTGGNGSVLPTYNRSAADLVLYSHEMPGGRASSSIIALISRPAPGTISPGSMPLNFTLTIKPVEGAATASQPGTASSATRTTHAGTGTPGTASGGGQQGAPTGSSGGAATGSGGGRGRLALAALLAVVALAGAALVAARR